MSDDTAQNRQSWLDKNMQSLIGDGNVAHLGGPGKRLNLDDNPYEPESQRMANRVMKDHNVLPSWIQMARDLDTERDGILLRLARLVRTYRGQLGDAQRANNTAMSLEIEAWWQTAQQSVRDQIKEYNRRILSYNISLPQGFEQRLQLQADEEIQQALNRREAGIDVRLNN